MANYIKLKPSILSIMFVLGLILCTVEFVPKAQAAAVTNYLSTPTTQVASYQGYQPKYWGKRGYYIYGRGYYKGGRHWTDWYQINTTCKQRCLIDGTGSQIRCEHRCP